MAETTQIELLHCRAPAPTYRGSVSETTDCEAPLEWQNKAQCYFLVGHFYNQKGDAARAIANYNRSIAIDPRVLHSSGRNPTGRRECDPRVERIEAGDPINDPTVVARLEKDANEDPRYAMSWLRLGLYYGVMRYSVKPPIDPSRFEPMIAYYSKAIELDPDYEEAWATRGVEFLGVREWDKALRDITKAIELDPTEVEFWRARALAYQSKGDFDQAKADLDKVIEMQPDHAMNWALRAAVYEKMGDREKSAADFCKADFVAARKPTGLAIRFSREPCPPNTPPSR